MKSDDGNEQDEWINVEAEAEDGTGPATAAILQSVSKVLEQAPEDRRYDLTLVVDEKEVA